MKLHQEPGGDANLSGEERDVAEYYEQQLGELCSCLRQLRGQWEQYLENLDQRHVFTAYQAQVVPASGRGDLISQEISFDPTNEQHLYALHYVFTACINAGITQFREGWNNHRIRTEHNLSPHQLFTAGLLRLQRSDMAAVDFFEAVHNEYGIEEDGLPGDIEDQAGVAVPEGRFALTEEQLDNLQQLVDPLKESSNYGIDLYEQTLYFINNL